MIFPPDIYTISSAHFSISEIMCVEKKIATPVFFNSPNMLNGHVPDAKNATIGNIEAHVLTGLTPMLSNASGYLWTAAYVNATGDLAADILSNIAAEQRAKVFSNICIGKSTIKA
ncbi:Manganese containing catalase [Acetivibrio saccincola]|uniref:Manganese containing catalase n=1 Tax=Acetivibrio saccincola TaxID=1677857 RepID=A0A2K9E4V2_9FIRM|nr:Manganese containing catalase [Acetivibrio saccincola]